MSVGGDLSVRQGPFGPAAQECPALWGAASPKGSFCFHRALTANRLHSAREAGWVILDWTGVGLANRWLVRSSLVWGGEHVARGGQR